MIFLTYDIHLLFLATSIGWVIARLIRFAIQKRGSLTRELTLVILFLFLWFLIRHTMEPYILTLDRSPLPPNLVPLRGLAQMLRRAMMVGNSITWWIVAINIIGNVVGFVPVGFLVSVLTPNRHKGWIALAIGFAVSLTIEILQLSFVIRVFDVDDLTDAQNKINQKVNSVGMDLSNVSGQLNKLMTYIQKMDNLIDQNNSKIEAFQNDLEERLPTETEKLELRVTDSNPFNVKTKDSDTLVIG